MFDVKISTVVIEKNLSQLKETVSILNDVKELNIVGKTATGNQGMSLIHNFAPQLLFLNVDLPDASGLDFVQVLHNRNIFPEIVFIADNQKLTYDSLELEPLDFIIRPFNVADIKNMLERLRFKLRKKELLRKMDIYTSEIATVEKKVFKMKGGILVIPVEEIVYLQADLTNSVLTLKSGEKIQLLTGISDTIETIDNNDFIRISRSYCINRNYLRKIDKRNMKCWMFSNGDSWDVPLSKNTMNQLEKLNVFPIY